MRPSGNSLKGSMLYRHEPWKTVGSCGTRPTMDRSAESPSFLESMPPIMILPARGSRMRRMQRRVVDLPQPVFPAKPTFSRPSMFTSTFSSTFLSLPYPAVRPSSFTDMPDAYSLFQRSNHKFDSGQASSSAIRRGSRVRLFTATMLKLLPLASRSSVQLGKTSFSTTPGTVSRPMPSGVAVRSGRSLRQRTKEDDEAFLPWFEPAMTLSVFVVASFLIVSLGSCFMSIFTRSLTVGSLSMLGTASCGTLK
mmetsp:Transcript_1506/g.2049  ORF Transcript_1506/g.2049 Transcript_1506/m.2049 type:complete len:251 (-) Transcript_1506:13-765(-)